MGSEWSFLTSNNEETVSYGQEIQSDPISCTLTPFPAFPRVSSLRGPNPATLPALQGDPAANANGLKREAGEPLHSLCEAIPALPPQR